MSLFAIADLHLSFANPKPMDLFGGHWKDHEQRIKNNWNQVVRPADVVLVCGDLSWAMKLPEAMVDLQWLAELNGLKVLIKGNHDYWWPDSINRLRAQLPPSIVAIHNDYVVVEGVAVCGTRGWVTPGDDLFTPHDEKIYRRELLRLEMSLSQAHRAGYSAPVVMLHYPPFNNLGQPSGFVDLMQTYRVTTCVYGHLHAEGQAKAITGHINGIDYKLVACDFTDFRPVSLDNSANSPGNF
ncbi:MAG: hypothetical protein HPY81_06740 [Firmicutes bacterium]|nr:hypothetical protein [Bacillota bacterium]